MNSTMWNRDHIVSLVLNLLQIIHRKYIVEVQGYSYERKMKILAYLVLTTSTINCYGNLNIKSLHDCSCNQ